MHPTEMHSCFNLSFLSLLFPLQMFGTEIIIAKTFMAIYGMNMEKVKWMASIASYFELIAHS